LAFDYLQVFNVAVTKLIIPLLLLTHLALAQATTPAPIPQINSNWIWYRGEAAETFLLKLDSELERGVRGLQVNDQIVGLTRWLIFQFDEYGIEPPKGFRVQVNHPGHNGNTMEVFFTYEFLFGRIRVPLMTFGGTLRGISKNAQTGETLIYFNLINSFVEPSSETHGYTHTAKISCDICDNAREVLSGFAYTLQKYRRNQNYVLAVRIPSKKEERIQVLAIQVNNKNT